MGADEDVATTTRLRKLDGLPTLPVVALRIGEVVHGRNASVAQVAEILRGDPATSAKLLRLVNSPYFGVPGGVSDVARAIPFIGFNTLYQLVLSISVFETLRIGGSTLDPRALWMHSLIVATAAREIAQEIRSGDPGAAFTAGLLHDMGKIALAKLDPDRLAAAFATVRTGGVSLASAERMHGLTPHDRVGSRLARLWKFPPTLAVPIEHHHAIVRGHLRDHLAPELRTLTEIVAVADHLSASCLTTFDDGAFAGDGEPDIAELFARNGLAVSQRDALCDRTRAQLERSRLFLSLLSG
ncbi:MAG TPA: HDOD domain-containing protein [Kofleriaceae bacterium]|nr:HDOD domain-containing protein [Kofleriaceae bacterium]